VFNDLHQVFESEDSDIADSVKQKQQLLRNSGTPGVGMNVEVWSTVDVLAQFHRGLCAHSLAHSIRLVLNVIYIFFFRIIVVWIRSHPKRSNRNTSS
jgi:hypothetical protein